MTRSPWWRDAVVYEIYVRSFADSDGDGEGDLQGVRSRLGYLRDLGVDALWLTPFYRSPLADGGYDVADYRDVDPRFGGLGDFDALVADAHAHGLRLIVDIVPNHTSDRHPWFQEALAAPPGSPARERYIFRRGRPGAGSSSGTSPGGGSSTQVEKDPKSVEGSSYREGAEGPPNDWPSAFGGPAWTRLPDGEWYLHLYAPEQPDLNWRNPEVRAEFEDILRFWLDRGVDGFRIDVAAGLFKDAAFADLAGRSRHVVSGPIYSRPEVHEVYRDWRRILDGYAGERMAIGEVWTESAEDLALFLRPDELHQVFQFDLQLAGWSAESFRQVVTTALAAVAPTGSAPTWVLSSHDSVRHVSRYMPPGGPPAAGLARARAALLFMLALPGSAYLYQGEELGLPEVVDLPDAARQDPVWKRSGGTQPGRDGCRVPLPWSGTNEPYGFSPNSSGAKPWLPMPPAWADLTVEAQLSDPGSTLSFYRRSLQHRRDLHLQESLDWLSADQDVVAFARGPLTCVLNCGERAVPLPADAGHVVISSAPADQRLRPAVQGQPHTDQGQPHTDQLLPHTDQDRSPTGQGLQSAGQDLLPADTCAWLLRAPQSS
ncbi:glycoside hydrolase family 13 protein [Actinomadura rudentiformis]|uniref:glycoside hydrolase family 13 protein n=1 Tax=Actinomadura rudentiformis TaxID=359158 RepID=UPI001CEFA3FF|nr:glycoside hydrolase family 13 protein [Actinomadura rudentiformis]